MTKGRPGRPLRPPLSKRELVAYNCGRRLGILGDADAALKACERGDLYPWLYRYELAACEAMAADAWWRWWWRGYGDGSRERA